MYKHTHILCVYVCVYSFTLYFKKSSLQRKVGSRKETDRKKKREGGREENWTLVTWACP